jgi:hypothetical protein
MILYKYYGFNSGVSALLSQQLGFREPRYFNDPFELSYLDNSDDLDFTASKINELSKLLVILSLTRTPYNPLMWAHYGEEHRGFVVGYEIEDEFLQSNDYNVIPASKGDVIYTSQKEQIELTIEIKEALHKAYLVSQGVNIDDYHGAERENIEKLLKKSLLYKHASWSYEEEVRVVKVLVSKFETSKEWQSNPNRSFSLINKLVAPGTSCSMVNGLYLFNKKINIREVYLGSRNPLRLNSGDSPIADTRLAELAEEKSWNVKLVNMSSGTWGLESEPTSKITLNVHENTKGLINSFSFNGIEASYLSESLPSVLGDANDRYELTNWSGALSLKKNGDFVA